MPNTTNTFQSIQPDLKDTYSDTKKKKRFSKLNDFYNKSSPAAKASSDPMKALKDKSYLNLKGKKGIAV